MKSRVLVAPHLSNPNRIWLARAIIALLAASALASAPHAQARVFLSVNIAPPLLPVYEQPDIPGPGYVWTPGYWAYASDGYYWVPGTWVRTPYVGALWTPGYWGWRNNGYYYNSGYWGLHVGYYGGIDYGFGYGGTGYNGGYWGHGRFYYNSAYNRFGSVRITSVYNRPYNHGPENHFSFNGPGGVDRKPTRTELTYSHERHTGPGREQVEQRTLASHNESLRASVNHGTPPIMATPRAGKFDHADAKSTVTGPHANEKTVVGAGKPTGSEKTVATDRVQGTERHDIVNRSAHVSHTTSIHTHHAAVATHAVHHRSTHVTHSSSHALRAKPVMHRTEHRAPSHGAPAMHSESAHPHSSSHMQAPQHSPASHGGENHPSSGGKPKDNGHGGG